MKKALVVGINNYPDAPLLGCVPDAKEFARLIEFNDDHSRNFNVNLQLNISRKHSLLEMITELFAGSNHTALLYFSGHGFLNELGGYLVTPDHQKYDQGISMNEILLLANQSKARDKIIILDCCHSGAMAEIPRLQSLPIENGITILTACRPNEAAMEVRGKGIFTSLLLEAMKGGAANISGEVTPGSIYAYIDQALGPWDQRPVFKANVSEFISLRTVAPRINVHTLREITKYFPDVAATRPLDPSYESTNDPEVPHLYKPPYATPEHVAVLQKLQQMHRAGLVAPVDETHMYWEAMNSGGCQLTPLGAYYHRLVKDKKI